MNRRILDTRNVGGHTQMLVKSDGLASAWFCSCNDLCCPYVMDVQKTHANALRSVKFVARIARSKCFK